MYNLGKNRKASMSEQDVQSWIKDQVTTNDVARIYNLIVDKPRDQAPYASGK